MPVVGPGGRVNLTDRKLAVCIPKGVIEGQHIRLAGQGAPSFNGGKAGDLFIEIGFTPHPVYRPEGRDLHLDLPVTPWEAALGGKIVMASPGGKIDLRIPENARGGQKLRVKGKGLTGKPAGDIYATLKIVNSKVSNEHA
ncbi:MAG: curved DNA-binding protein [Ascidiaceihabitans sp.]|jgi:curved DNA-binding protein